MAQVVAFVDLKKGQRREIEVIESDKLQADRWVVAWKHPHLSLMADDVLLPFEGLQAGVAGEEPLGAVHVLFVDL